MKCTAARRIAFSLFAVYVMIVLADGMARQAQAAPEIKNLSLRGLQIGGETTITIDGAQLDTETRVVLPLPIASQQIQDTRPSRLVVSIVLSQELPPGIYPLRLANRHGISEPVLVGIDALPQQPFAEKVDRLPVALHGNLTGSAVLRTRFVGKKGQEMVVDLEARRLGGKLLPVLHLYDPHGVQIAWNQDEDSIERDARLSATLPADGEYTVELHDAIYRGNAPGHFRLKLGALSYADHPYPLAVERGRQTVVAGALARLPSGSHWPVRAGGRETSLPLPWTAGPSREGDVLTGGRPSIAVSDHAEVVEASLGDDRQTPAAPVGISGRLSQHGEQDAYLVPVKPGEKMQVEVRAARLGAPVDGVLHIYNEQGSRLAGGDDQTSTVDPIATFTVPKDAGKVRITLEDLHGRGGEAAVYHLSVTPENRPEFSVKLSTDRTLVPQSGAALLRVEAARRGYNGPIKLHIGELPAGVSLQNAEIPPGVSAALVSFSASGVSRGHALCDITAAAPDGKQIGRVSAAASPLPRWLQHQIAVATTEAAAVQLQWPEPVADLNLPLGRRVPLKIALRANGKLAGNLRLSLITSQKVPQKKIKKDNKDVMVDDEQKALRLAEAPLLASDTSEAELVLLVPADLPQLEYDLAIKAEVLSANSKQVTSTAVSPALRLKARTPAATAPLLLWEDDAALAEKLTGGQGQAKVVTEQPYSGQASLQVAPPGKSAPQLGNLAVQVRQFPREGEIRYIRFAWKKQEGAGIGLGLGHDGKLGQQNGEGSSYHYLAGKSEGAPPEAVQVGKNLPSEWTVVTRDLYRDFGEFTLTGLSFQAAGDGAAWFDHIYAGRSPADFQEVTGNQQ